MLAALWIVSPVFALIAAGFLAGRLKLFGPGAVRELNRFVVWLALPALLFDVMANAPLAQIWQPGFIVCFTASALPCCGIVLAVSLRRRQAMADAAIEALSAGYANVGYMGFPITLAAVGPAAFVPTTIASIITVCIVFALAIILVEAGRQEEKAVASILVGLGRKLLRNPLLVSPVLGALVAAAHCAVPAPVETFLKMLGGAASPCALVCLGLYLASGSCIAKAGGKQPLILAGCKLLLQPAIAAALAFPVLHLAAPQARAAILLAALPTGTGPFMLAELYGRSGHIVARVVIISTLASLLTLPLLVHLLG